MTTSDFKINQVLVQAQIHNISVKVIRYSLVYFIF